MHIVNDEIEGGANQLVVGLIEGYLDGVDVTIDNRAVDYEMGYRAAVKTLRDHIDKTLLPTRPPVVLATPSQEPVEEVSAPPISVDRPGLPTTPPPPR